MKRNTGQVAMAIGLLLAIAGCSKQQSEPAKLLVCPATTAPTHTSYVTDVKPKKAVIQRVMRQNDTLEWQVDPEGSVSSFWVWFVSQSIKGNNVPCNDLNNCAPCANGNLKNGFPGSPNSPATCTVISGLTARVRFHYEFTTDANPPRDMQPPGKQEGKKESKRKPLVGGSQSCDACEYEYAN